MPRLPHVLLVLPLALAGCGEARSEGAAPARAGILVVAVDGLRADHLSCHGYGRPTTPTLDGLAAEGVRFETAIAPSPLGLPAHLGILTGVDPYLARRFVDDEAGSRGWAVPEVVPSLAVELLASGWTTAAFLDTPVFGRVDGFARGFQEVHRAPRDELGAERTTERLLAWLRQLGDRPWFAYLQLADLERSWSAPSPQWSSYFEPDRTAPWVPPVANTDHAYFALPISRWRGHSRSLAEYEAAYDGHVRAVDRALGGLMGALRRLGREEDTTLAVVGAHGTQFGEAGLFLESGHFSLADVGVPWILRPAPARHDANLRAGRVVPHVASLLDLAPTLLELEGLAPAAGMHGRSQLGALAGGAGPERPWVISSCGRLPGCAVFGERHALELLAPAQLDDGALRRSWYGRLSVEEDADFFVRAYDRVEEPFPPLVARPPRKGEPTHALRGAALEWAEDMHDARVLLLGDARRRAAVAPERARELVDKGILASRP